MSPVRESGEERIRQKDVSSTAGACKDILGKTLSLSEIAGNAASAGGQRAFELESEKYVNTVLRENLPGCTAYAAAHSDADLSRMLFELALSSSNSAAEALTLELARLYTKDPKMTATILLNFDREKRRSLIEKLQDGLDTLYHGKPGSAARAKILKQRLHELE